MLSQEGANGSSTGGSRGSTNPDQRSNLPTPQGGATQLGPAQQGHGEGVSTTDTLTLSRVPLPTSQEDLGSSQSTSSGGFQKVEDPHRKTEMPKEDPPPKPGGVLDAEEAEAAAAAAAASAEKEAAEMKKKQERFDASLRAAKEKQKSRFTQEMEDAIKKEEEEAKAGKDSTTPGTVEGLQEQVKQQQLRIDYLVKTLGEQVHHSNRLHERLESVEAAGLDGDWFLFLRCGSTCIRTSS